MSMWNNFKIIYCNKTCLTILQKKDEWLVNEYVSNIG